MGQDLERYSKKASMYYAQKGFTWVVRAATGKVVCTYLLAVYPNPLIHSARIINKEITRF